MAHRFACPHNGPVRLGLRLGQHVDLLELPNPTRRGEPTRGALAESVPRPGAELELRQPAPNEDLSEWSPHPPRALFSKNIR
jgi:hypothetical protein